MSANMRIKFQSMDSNTAEIYMVPEGTDVQEFLTDYAEVNPNKVAVIVDGIESSLGAELVSGQTVALRAKKYTSGC